MTAALPPFIPRAEVQARLRSIFPDGLPDRNFLVRDLAGATVFTMLYVGAVETAHRYIAPKHVYRMSDEQAAMGSDAARLEYGQEVAKPGSIPRGKAWYADNTREPIRDETLRQGLVRIGAAVDRRDLPTTSSAPRYALRESFAALFDPMLKGAVLEAAIEAWQGAHLSKAELTRIAVTRAGAGKGVEGVAVHFPNGTVRHLSPGPSSVIAKAVVEEFAPRFLIDPAVLWLSESANKVVAQDDALAKSIGLHIDKQRNLPDIILVDRGPPTVLIFVEVVATDGPVSEARREELWALTKEAGFAPSDVAFLTAFLARADASLRRSMASLAWNSFVWVASEPAALIALIGPQEPPVKLSSLLMK